MNETILTTEEKQEVDDRVFFHLLEKAGVEGRYQKSLVIIMSVIGYLCGGLMLITPYLVQAAPRLAAGASARRRTFRLLKSDAAEEPEEARDPVVVVVGFGPAGRAAAERVAEAGARAVVVDQNPKSIREARRLGYDAVTGDARHVEVLEHAHVTHASHVLVTLPGPEAAAQVVRTVRLMAPRVTILARSRFHRTLGLLTAAGAHTLVDEEYESGRRLAEAWEESRPPAALPSPEPEKTQAAEAA